MKIPRLLLPLLLCAAVLASAKAQADVKLLAPPPGAVPAVGPTRFIGFSGDRALGKLAAEVNGKAYPVEFAEGVFVFEAPLISGKNLLKVGGESFTYTAGTPSGPTVHPSLLEQCGDCHLLGEERSLQLVQKADLLCLGCHGGVRSLWNPDSEHAQAEGCLTCHNPHKGRGPKLLTFDAAKECLACHDSPAKPSKPPAPAFTHGPLNAGGCTDCHAWHADGGGSQLAQTGAALCDDCHSLPLSTGALPTALSKHPPVRDGKCSLCHEPHAADNRYLLRKNANEVCEGCHNLNSHRHTTSAKPRLPGIKVPADWPRSKKSLACWGCHAGHASKEPGFLNQPKAKLCAACHS